jgi:hypothetical protein
VYQSPGSSSPQRAAWPTELTSPLPVVVSGPDPIAEPAGVRSHSRQPLTEEVVDRGRDVGRRPDEGAVDRDERDRSEQSDRPGRTVAGDRADAAQLPGR